MLDEDKLKLVYVNPVGKNGIEWYEYDFYFASNPDIVWGSGWDCEFASQERCYPPDKKTYSEVLRLKTNIPLYCAQNNPCYGMRYAVEGIISIAFEDISEYEEYPEPCRIVFQYGETYRSVENKLARRHQIFNEKNCQAGPTCNTTAT